MENGIKYKVNLINDVSGLSYDKNTIKVLKHLGIRIAFRDNSIKLEKKYINKNLEVPRVDHNRI